VLHKTVRYLVDAYGDQEDSVTEVGAAIISAERLHDSRNRGAQRRQNRAVARGDALVRKGTAADGDVNTVHCRSGAIDLPQVPIAPVGAANSTRKVETDVAAWPFKFISHTAVTLRKIRIPVLLGTHSSSTT